MNTKNIILAVDDNPPSLALLVDILTPEGYQVYPADSGELALAAITANLPNLILLDIHMKGISGLEVCRQLKANEETRIIPIILISGLAETSDWVEGLRMGADDYIIKPFKSMEILSRVKTHLTLSKANASILHQANELRQINEQMQLSIEKQQQVENELQQNLNRVERSRKAILSTLEDQKRIESELRESEVRYRTLFESSNDGIIITDTETKAFMYANPSICRMLGYTDEEMKKLSVFDIHPKNEIPHIIAAFDSLVRGEQTNVINIPCLRKDGSTFYVDITSTMINIEGRNNLVGFLRDITERKQAETQRAKLEEQIRQQQRLDIVGQLSAGIAHDFNNILSGISGFTQFTYDALPEITTAREDLAEVLALAKRATILTRQLLTFSRQQTLLFTLININDLIRETLKMLSRLIGENIILNFLPATDKGTIMADQGQIEQVLINLAVNARDAMPDGGKLIIETNYIEIDNDYASTHNGILPGLYVMISVIDNGCGMDANILKHMFEPFYTTKTIGKGTGLGLATVYGIVKQHNGNIEVFSEPDCGTTFKVYLPYIEENIAPVIANKPMALPSGTETILIVEDEESVRNVVGRILKNAGYKVLTAALPSIANGIIAEHGDDISLLLTDVMMPELNGMKLFESIQVKYPLMRVLFMSGYNDDVIVKHGILDKNIPFIQKPFNDKELLIKVYKVLGGIYNE